MRHQPAIFLHARHVGRPPDLRFARAIDTRDRMNSTTLQTLLDEKAPLARIAEHLDGLTHEERTAQAGSIGRAAQRKLWNLAPTTGIDLEHFVPATLAPKQPVRHIGRNTLPVPGPFRRFEKRFCAPETGRAEKLFGYNEGITRGPLGPGFFVVHATAGNKLWEERGAIVVDYFDVPDSAVAEGWPKVIPNSQGLQKLVYFHTRDFMRKVSKHVSIGAAHKEEKPLDHYFTLVRES